MAGTGSAGSLVVSLGLNAAEFFAGLTKSEYEARRAADTIKTSFGNIQSAVTKLAAVLGVGLGIDAFKNLVTGAIQAEEELQLLGDRAGLTGAQLSAFIGVAARSHTDLETVVQASAKLSKALLDFSDEGAKSTLVLKALGISANEIPGLLAAPNQALLSIAKTLDQLPAGGTKAAANLLILGRGGSQAAALLAELAKTQVLVNTRTQEQIDSAKELADRFVDLGVKTDTLKTTFANALIEPINGALDAFVKLTTGANSTQQALEQLVRDGAIKEWARDSIIVLGTFVESLIFVARAAIAVGSSFKAVAADIKVFLHEVGETVAYGAAAPLVAISPAHAQAIKDRDAAVISADKNYVDLINKNATFITDAIKDSFAKQDAAFAAAKQPKNITFADIQSGSADVADKAKARVDAAARVQKALSDAAKHGPSDDPTKKLLEGQIKALEDNIAREKDLLRTREEFIATSFQQGYLSIKDSFDRTQEARDEALRNTLGFYDEQIALQRVFIAKSTTSEVNRADARNKIAEYQAKEAKAVGDSIVDTQRQAIARTIADDQYAAQLDELNAKVQELAGNTAKAAAIRFGTSQNTPFFRSLTPEARDQFNAIGQQEIAQKALNDKNTEFRLILDAVGTAQEKINLLQQTGAISEIDALVKTSAAARQQIEVLTDLADKAEIAAQALTGIAKLEAIANVERLRLEIAKLGSQTDLLGDKFQNIFKTSFVDNLTAAIAGTKSWADAFKDAEKQIVESISRIAAQNIGDALFGKEGPLGGLGSIFGQIFGSTASGGDKGAGAAAANAALGTLSLTSATVTTSFATVATSAAAAAAALSTVAATSGSSSAGGLAGLFSGIFGGGGGGYGQFDAVSGYAKGTDFHPGGLAWVGEGGKELLNLPRGTQVIPQDKLRGMGRPNLSIVVNVPQGTSGPSADQIGVRVGAHVQRALNRNS